MLRDDEYDEDEAEDDDGDDDGEHNDDAIVIYQPLHGRCFGLVVADGEGGIPSH